MKANEFIEYLEESQNIELSEVDAKRLKELLAIVINLLKVRGITLNRTEQEKVVFSLARALG